MSNSDLVFQPPLKNWDRSVELIDQLQNTLAPNIFRGRAVYDGKKNLFAPMQLSFPSNSVSGTVGQIMNCYALLHYDQADCLESLLLADAKSLSRLLLKLIASKGLTILCQSAINLTHMHLGHSTMS